MSDKFFSRPRLLKTAGAVLLLFLFIGVLPAFLQVNLKISHEDCFCTSCSKRLSADFERRNRGDAVFKNEKYQETDLSLWYREHYGNGCNHQWAAFHGSGTGYLEICGYRIKLREYNFSASTPVPLDMTQVDRLFTDDPEFCKRYIEYCLRNYRSSLSEDELQNLRVDFSTSASKIEKE